MRELLKNRIKQGDLLLVGNDEEFICGVVIKEDGNLSRYKLYFADSHESFYTLEACLNFRGRFLEISKR